jgi:hypothetical protein
MMAFGVELVLQGWYKEVELDFGEVDTPQWPGHGAPQAQRLRWKVVSDDFGGGADQLWHSLGGRQSNSSSHSVLHIRRFS